MQNFDVGDEVYLNDSKVIYKITGININPSSFAKVSYDIRTENKKTSMKGRQRIHPERLTPVVKNTEDYTYNIMDTVKWENDSYDRDAIFIIANRWRTWDQGEERYRIIHCNSTYVVSKYMLKPVDLTPDQKYSAYEMLWPLKIMPTPTSNKYKEEKEMAPKPKPFDPNDYSSIKSVSIERLMKDKACPEAIAYLAERYAKKGYGMNGLGSIDSNELARLHRFNPSWVQWLINMEYIEKKETWKVGDLIQGSGPENYKWIILEDVMDNTFRAFSTKTNREMNLIYYGKYKNLGPLHDWVKDLKI